MPPKKKDEPPKLTKKQKEALALEQALKRANDEARRNYVQQDKLRAQAEKQARAQHDEERFDRAAEVKRLNEEMQAFREVGDDIVVRRRLALLEHAKHTGWQNISDCSWLPDPDSEPDIHSFLSNWRDEQNGAADLVPGNRETHESSNTDYRVTLKRIPQPPGAPHPFVTGHVYIQHDDTPAAPEVRRTFLDTQLDVCTQAVELVHNIQMATDKCQIRQQDNLAEMHTRHQVEVNEAMLEALDTATCVVLNHLETFFDPPEIEAGVLRAVPERTANPAIRFGLWMKERTRNQVGSIKYPEPLGILIEPKDSQTHKLPKALGLQHRDNIVIRAMQFNFDPLSILTPPSVGQEFYALDCVLILESLTCPERPKKIAEWTCRVEPSGGPRELHRNQYPPKNEKDATGGGGGVSKSSGGAASSSSGGGAGGGAGGTGDSEYTMKVTFEIPETVSLRTRQPIIGRWNPATKLWDPCSTGRLGPDSMSRKVSFLTSDLTALALVQEKGFDVPYERWQIYPNGLDSVMVILEGRHREDTTARGGVELRILVREQECCLLGPEERELSHIRGRWLSPLTLLRLLSKAGYNFVLSDADAEFIPSVLPRTNSLETNAYFDISLFCLTHSFASTRHNRIVEDPQSGLFRVSKDQRPNDQDSPFPVDVDEQQLWHSIRFEEERVVVADFKEDEEVPSLQGAEGHESHLNLFTVLQKIYGDEDVHFRATASNPLVQDCVFHLLRLTRPLTWG